MYKDWKLGEIFLLLSQFFERIAHYSITANLVLMLLSHPLNWSTYNSLAAPFLLNGFSFVSSMIGGVLSDTCLKKYMTVILGYIFYISYIGFPYIFWNDNVANWCQINNKTNATDVNIVSETCSNILLPSIILSSIGSGLIRSVVASMGMDMVNKRWENPSTFFNLYYWCLNGGSLIAFLLFSLVQQRYSRRWGYAAPAIILASSFILFLMGGPFYINKKKPERSTIALVFKIYIEACRKKIILWRERKLWEEDCSESQENIISPKHHNSLFQEESDVEQEFPDSFSSVTVDNSLAQKSELGSITYSKKSSINKNFGATTTSSHIVETESYIRTDNVSFLDRCQIRFGGTFHEADVEDVRKFTFILVILLFMVPYYMIYFQMESTYMYQGMNMRVEVGTSKPKFTIPASWLIVLDIILLMFLLPFLVNVVYPWLRTKRKYMRQTSKIALGFVFVGFSVAIAGAVETRRLYVRWYLNENISQIIDNTTYVAADMTIFYQVPQYVFMGFSEALAVVAGLELACTQVSAPMRGLTNGLFWFTSGLGSFVGSGSLYIFKHIRFTTTYSCRENNLTCHLNLYFFILTGFITLIFLFFILFLWKYRKVERVEQNQLFMRRVSV